jgi:hypothetical protein
MPPRLLMLCASDPDLLPPVMLADPDPEPEPDYYGRPDMYDDELRDESARLGLLAQQVSSGRPVRLEYAGVITDHDRQQAAGLTAEEVTEDDCTEVGMRLVALSGLPFADLMEAAREIAFERDEQTANEYRSVAAGLVELTGRLGYDTDQLSGDSLVALAAVAEEDRLDRTASLAAGQQAEVDRLVALSGKLITTKTRAHASDLEGYEDPADRDQPAKGVHRKVTRYLKMREDMFGGEAGHAGSHGSHSYGPGPYRPPGSSGKPQSPAQRDRLRAKIRARGPGARPD